MCLTLFGWRGRDVHEAFCGEAQVWEPLMYTVQSCVNEPNVSPRFMEQMLHRQMVVCQLGKKHLALYGTQKFVTMLTKAHHSTIF
jgi:hypothetical protein